mgnify:FL=1
MITKSINFKDYNGSLMLGNVGIEKESLRISDLKLSKIPHDELLGSALFNRYITTDFSDAQIEFITPPFNQNENVSSFLDNLHHYTSKKINEEILWPLSMPPTRVLESEIPIAKYGKSNYGLLKEIYRRGLSNRYGKLMQTISGVHFNYSLPEEIWDADIFFSREKKSNKLINQIYMGTIRNLHRYNWLLIYLLGCSPTVSRYFINNSYAFQNINKEDFFLPFATSFRMSDLGYQNDNQSKLSVSYNSIEDHLSDLRYATKKPNELFMQIPHKTEGLYNQLNANHLQIEDEYYAIARPKSAEGTNKRQLNKIQINGINYIELRSIDLNPFHPNGIDQDTLNFLEIFILYCTIEESRRISTDDLKVCKANDLKVAIEGRKPGLKINNKGKDILLSAWALEIIEEMESLIGNFKNQANRFNNSIAKMKKRVIDSNKTPSSKLLELILDKNITFNQVGYEIGSKYLEDYISISKDSNELWEELEHEKESSVLLQNKEDSNQHKSFDKYLNEYLSN